MEKKERFEFHNKIVERAEKMGIVDPRDARWERMLDINFADEQFDLELEMFLNASDEDFVHDWCGIQRHMNRATCKVEDFFLPRFAGVCHKRKEEIA